MGRVRPAVAILAFQSFLTGNCAPVKPNPVDPSIGAPDTPTIEGITSDSFTVAWTPIAKDAVKKEYIVETKKDPKNTSSAWVQAYAGGLAKWEQEKAEPGNTYVYRVAQNQVDVGGKMKRSLWSEELVLNFTVPKPPLPVKLLTKNQTSIKVRWEEPMDDSDILPMTHFLVEGRIEAGNWTLLYKGLKTTHTITGLMPGDEVTYRVKAVNMVGKSAPSKLITYASDPDIPDDPEAPKACNATIHSITLCWPQPNDRGDPIWKNMLEYQLQATTAVVIDLVTEPDPFKEVWRGVPEEEDNGQITVPLKRLFPGSTYGFRVRASNNLGDSAWSKTSSLMTLPDVPSPIYRALEIVDRTSTSITVTFDWVMENGNPLIGYLVEFSYKKPNPKGREYDDFECQYGSGLCMPENKTGFPNDTFVVKKVSSAGEQWSFFKKCYFGKKYEDVVCKGLPKGTPIKIRARGENDLGGGKWSPILTNATLNAGPETPQPVFSGEITPREIQVKWKVPVQNGAKITRQYMQMMYTGTTSFPDNYRPPSFGGLVLDKTNLWERVEFGRKYLNTSYTITGLFPASSYRFKIAMENPYNKTKDSREVIIKTQPDIPVRPKTPDLMGAGLNHINISWAFPPNNGLNITTFILEEQTIKPKEAIPEWRQLWNCTAPPPKPPKDPYEDDDEDGNSTNVTNTTNVTIPESRCDWVGRTMCNFTHRGLKPGAEKKYRVFAYNALGKSKVGFEQADAKTKTLPPEMPEIPWCDEQGKNWLLFNWDLPYDGGAPITKCEMTMAAKSLCKFVEQCKSPGGGPPQCEYVERCEWHNVYSGKNNKDVKIQLIAGKPLRMLETYRFKLQCFNDKGASPITDEEYCKTRDVDPATPTPEPTPSPEPRPKARKKKPKEFEEAEAAEHAADHAEHAEHAAEASTAHLSDAAEAAWHRTAAETAAETTNLVTTHQEPALDARFLVENAQAKPKHGHRRFDSLVVDFSQLHSSEPLDHDSQVFKNSKEAVES